jgi:predicted Zn-dependent protease
LLNFYGLDDLAIQLADSKADQLPGDALRALLVAEFNQRQMERFGELWGQHETMFTDDRGLSLYHTAWSAAWGPPAGLLSGRAELAAAQLSADASVAELAHHLQLPVSFALSDLDGHRRALDWLREHHADKVAEQLDHWRLLAVTGRRGEAQSLAKSFARPPATAADAINMARLYAQLGLEDYAAGFLEKQIGEFGYSAQLWVLLAQQHIRLKRWTELRALSVTMRNTPELRGALDGYSQFLAGLADHRLGRRESAEAAFAKVPDAPFNDPLVAYNVAAGLRGLGYPALSARLLQTLEQNFGEKAQFWFQLTSAAYEAREMDVLAAAAQKAWELEPGNPAYMNNYAAVLLVTRQKPEESIKITLRLLAAEPKSNDRKVNHILALLQNERLADAEAQLKDLNPGALNVNEGAIANYAWFELHVRRGEKELARKRYPTVERSQLLQPQLDWMDAEFKKLGTDRG